MFNKALSDYQTIGKVEDDIIQKYQDFLPKEWISVWKEYGYGTFFEGFFRVINPDEYLDVLKESYYRYEECIPIMVTAFGDLIVWQNDKTAVILHYPICQLDVLDVDFDIFFFKLEDKKYSIEDFEEEGMPFGLYQKAIKKYGLLKFDECFKYKKALKQGGKRTVSNLTKSNAKDYMNACIEAFGGVYDEPGPRFNGEITFQAPKLEWKDKSGMFEDLNFKLVVINSLLDKENSFSKKLNVIKNAYRESSGGIIPEMLEFFAKVKLTQADLDKVTVLDFDGGNDIYFLINPYWDGEDDCFEVHSIEGYQKLKNLKKVNWTSMCERELIEEYLKLTIS